MVRSEVVVCSTGLIGERLPMPKLLAGVDAAVVALAVDGGPAAADAIRTTDTVAKTAVVAKAVSPGPAPVAKTAVVAAAVTPGRGVGRRRRRI